MNKRANDFARTWIRLAAGLALSCNSSLGQTFTSGSTGADGALHLTAPGVMEFNPKAFTPPLDPEGDNVFHFTTITIGTQTTVRLTAKYFTGPVYWLASGEVAISGWIDLDGEPGHRGTNLHAERIPSLPGAGGFPGGVGGGYGTPYRQTPGGGPGGGGIDTSATPGFNFGRPGGNGRLMANQFLVPILGGGGGGGAWGNHTWPVWGGGGAGGGAILIASGTAIRFVGTAGIRANGGSGRNEGGHGGPGAIRLIAPLVASTTAGAGLSASSPANQGIVRIEAFQHQFLGAVVASYYRTSPNALNLPDSPPPLVRVKSIGGIDLPEIPSGSFEVPDAVVNSPAALAVEIVARRIPPGARPVLTLLSEDGPDRILQAPDLAGTLEESVSTVQVLFPRGYSRGFVKVSWNQ